MNKTESVNNVVLYEKTLNSILDYGNEIQQSSSEHSSLIKVSISQYKEKLEEFINSIPNYNEDDNLPWLFKRWSLTSALSQMEIVSSLK